MRMLLRWLPIVLAAIVGGFGSATLYPLAWRALGAPMNGLAGIGTVLIGFAGAVFCGFGAMAPWKAWSGSGARTPYTVATIAPIARASFSCLGVTFVSGLLSRVEVERDQNPLFSRWRETAGLACQAQSRDNDR